VTSTSSLPDRLPPTAEEAEKAVLGACLLEEGAVQRALAILEPADFAHEAGREIFAAIAHLANREQPVNPVTVSTRLKEVGKLEVCGGMPFLLGLVNELDQPRYVVRYAQIVHEKASLRELIRLAHDLELQAYEDPEDARKLLEQAANDTLRLLERQGEVSARSFEEEDWASVDRALQTDGSVTQARWGIGELDRHTGGLGNSSLTLLMAMQGAGKTRLGVHAALSSAREFARDANGDDKPHVLVFPLEEGRAAWMRNAIAWLGRLDSFMLLPGRCPADEREEFQRKARAAHEELMRLPVVLADNVATAEQLRAIIRIEARQRRLGLVVIDYLQRLGRSADDERRALAEVSLDLQSTSQALGVPILLLSQLSYADVPGDILPYGGRGPAFDATLALVLTRQAAADGLKSNEGKLTLFKTRLTPEFAPVRFHISWRNGGHFYDEHDWAEIQAREPGSAKKLEVYEGDKRNE